MPETLAAGILRETARALKLLELYAQVDTGAFGAAVIRTLLIRTMEATLTGDTVEMMCCYSELQGLK